MIPEIGLVEPFLLISTVKRIWFFNYRVFKARSKNGSNVSPEARTLFRVAPLPRAAADTGGHAPFCVERPTLSSHSLSGEKFG